jgi:hypothetical protein
LPSPIRESQTDSPDAIKTKSLCKNVSLSTTLQLGRRNAKFKAHDFQGEVAGFSV